MIAKKCKLELADPLEMINIQINRQKGVNPNHVFSQVTRSRVADIEKNINIDVHVKTVMIDIEEAPKLGENTKIDIDLI